MAWKRRALHVSTDSSSNSNSNQLLFGRHGTSISARGKAPAFSTFPNAPPYLLPPWPPRNQPRARRCQPLFFLPCPRCCCSSPSLLPELARSLAAARPAGVSIGLLVTADRTRGGDRSMRMEGGGGGGGGAGVGGCLGLGQGGEAQIKGTHTHGGRYVQYNVYGNLFEVSAKYVPPIRPVGRGAFGIICAAVNAQTREEVAIKKIGNAFDNQIDAKRTLREIKLLRHMNHDNVISLKDIIRPPRRENFNDVYIVYELMDTDLHHLLRSNQPLTDDHCQYFVYQLLRGLKYVHSANVLHRDLRPSNLLLNAKCDLKIGDFGLARTTTETDFMMEYVVTRWYRAPELLLNCSEYTQAIDMWSVGCILGEMVTREPLFPGKDYVHQLRLITELVGSPDDTSLGFLRSDNARRYVRSLPQYPKQHFGARFPTMSSGAMDLLERMLVFDPSKRITVDEALCHPYLASLHEINDEPVCPAPFSFDFEHPSLTEEDIKELIWRESLKFNPDPIH